MRPQALPVRRRGLLGLVAGLSGLAASAADPPAAPAAGAAPSTALDAELVKTGLYLIRGGGSHSLLRLSQSGAVLVNGKAPEHYRALRAQIRRISRLSDLPVRVLVVTNHHAAHVGSAPQFLASGVALLAQQNASRRLTPGAGLAAAARPGGQVVAFDRDYQLHIGGVDLRLHHFGAAQTDSDVVVHFPDLRVIAVGELCSAGTPVPDYAGGGRLLGWGPVLAQVLQLEFDLVVPSSGPLLGRAELAGFKARLDLLAARALGLARQGVAKDQWLRQWQTDDLGWSSDDFADVLDPLLAELSAAT